MHRSGLRLLPWKGDPEHGLDAGKLYLSLNQRRDDRCSGNGSPEQWRPPRVAPHRGQRLCATALVWPSHLSLWLHPPVVMCPLNWFLGHEGRGLAAIGKNSIAVTCGTTVVGVGESEMCAGRWSVFGRLGLVGEYRLDWARSGTLISHRAALGKSLEFKICTVRIWSEERDRVPVQNGLDLIWSVDQWSNCQDITVPLQPCQFANEPLSFEVFNPRSTLGFLWV
jgi:hypothetical protein